MASECGIRESKATDAQPADEAAQGDGGTPSVPPDFEIVRGSLAKKGPKAVQYTCWVRIAGLVDVLFRVIPGKYGCFVKGPDGQAGGRLFRRLRFVDSDTEATVEDCIMAAYRAELTKQNLREPEPPE